MKNPSTPIAYMTKTSMTLADSEYTPSVANTRMPAYSSGRGTSSTFTPQPDQRQVQEQEHDIADVQRRDQRTHEVAVVREQLRPRLEVEDLERREHDRRRRRRRDAERQQGHERPGRRVVRRL